jgi:hypothetical protein
LIDVLGDIRTVADPAKNMIAYINQTRYFGLDMYVYHNYIGLAYN